VLAQRLALLEERQAREHDETMDLVAGDESAEPNEPRVLERIPPR
jgi:hypothetical protein